MSPEPEPQPEQQRIPSVPAVAGAHAPALVIVIAARNEADRIGATLAALGAAWPHASLVVADDASQDQTAAVAARGGAIVIGGSRRIGKGGNISRAILDDRVTGGAIADDDLFLLCDGDLAESAARLGPLVASVAAGDCALAVARFARRRGGGFGFAVGYAHDAIERLCGFDALAPISGQRALNGVAIRAALPFADAYGMEIAMTVDVVRAGLVVNELELDLAHRATTRSPAGFLHRARQLRDFRRVARTRA